jgi:alkylated DNA repair dioxygenase AlkB
MRSSESCFLSTGCRIFVLRDETKTMEPIAGTIDSYLLTDLFPWDLSVDIFEKVRDEVVWSEMYQKGGAVPRLVCLQGDVKSTSVSCIGSDDKAIQHHLRNIATREEPVYRHPVDLQPPLHEWTPTVRTIRDAVVKRIQTANFAHLTLFNHVLIQMYRSGMDYISEHADKTLDIARNSPIVNVSFGAQRMLILRPKRDRYGDGSSYNSSKPSILVDKTSLDGDNIIDDHYSTNYHHYDEQSSSCQHRPKLLSLF